ncbi:MAG: (2Fe-2S) ferredoxin domain-containing protein [Eubacteriales bacterium]|nr:(2Fe-2S) ferredoxin domain-containing protein [Eubacteriales bacterium]
MKNQNLKTRRKTMVKVTVCIGSSCHIKGSRQVVEQLQYLIGRDNLGDKVELGGTFCMGKCQKGVCVTVDDNFYSVSPDTVDEFFEKEVKTKAV